MKTTKDEIYQFYKRYIEEHKYAPSFREVGKALNLKSPNTVKRLVDMLIEDGRLETDSDRIYPRAIRIKGMEIIFREGS